MLLGWLIKPVRFWLNRPLWQQIAFALIAGIIVGSALGHKAEVLKPLGTLFIHAIKMMVVPVVFTAIVCAVLSMQQSARVGRIWTKALALYAGSMVLSTAIGLTLTSWVKPGVGINLSQLHHAGSSPVDAKQAPDWAHQLINIVPSNPVMAFAHGNILQILVFALILGVAINKAGKPAQPVADLFQAFSTVVFKFAGIIMAFAPYGIFALMAWSLGKFGVSVLWPLLQFVGLVYAGCIILIIFYYGGGLLFWARRNPIHFMRSVASAAIMAFTTSSSAATLPQTLRCARQQLQLDEGISGFLLPLGSTLNLNGLSIYISSATVFAANIYGIHLGMGQYLTILISTLLAAMGAAAVPGSAIIVMGAVMSSISIPLGALPLIAGVDRLNDMAQTSTNVLGDLFATTVIADSEQTTQQGEEVL